MSDQVIQLRSGRQVQKKPIRKRSPRRPEIKKMAGALQKAFQVDSSKQKSSMEFTEKIDPAHLESFRASARSATGPSNPILPESPSRYSSLWTKWTVGLLLTICLGLWLWAASAASTDIYNITMNSEGMMKIKETISTTSATENLFN